MESCTRGERPQTMQSQEFDAVSCGAETQVWRFFKWAQRRTASSANEADFGTPTHLSCQLAGLADQA